MMERCKCRSGSSIIRSVPLGAVKTFPATNIAFLSPSDSSAALYSGPPCLLAIRRSFVRMLMVIGMFDWSNSWLMTAIGASFFAASAADSISSASTKAAIPRARTFSASMSS